MSITSATPVASKSLTVAFDIALPPSQNRLWRAGRSKRGKLFVYRDKKYLAWLRTALWEMRLQMGPLKVFGPIAGPFSATIIIYKKTKRKFDLDNRVKALLDAAQQAQIVTDDANCRQLKCWIGSAEEAPSGARLIIKALK